MSDLVRCANGHQWRVPESAATTADPTVLICPVCGGLPTLNGRPDRDATVLAEMPPTLGNDTTRTRTPPPVPGPAVQSASYHIPGYEILETVGRGGMGMVFRARQTALDRVVAVKVIYAHFAQDFASLARFRAEAHAVAQMDHPNIVKIYEIGEAQGTPYLCLEFVAGGSLARRLKQSSYSPRQSAQLVEVLARAVEYSHGKGIVHRDLKPGNILLGEDGTPKVTDFGVAKRLEALAGSDAPLTRTGDVLGTPSYMAPEQAAGDSHGVGPATDVYALGAILYELLTGRPPFQGATALSTITKVLEEEPVPPQQVQAKVPTDLQTICLTCLRKDPARRYGSAAALAADLKAYLAGEPIQARPATRWERLGLWARRRPLLAAAVGVGLVALAAVLAGAYLFRPLAVAGVAVLGLVAGAWWYGARLQRALRHLEDQQLRSERNVERLFLLLETTQRLMKVSGPDELLRVLTETTARMANAERATVFLLDGDRGELWSKVAMGDGVGEIRVTLGQGVAGAVALSGETVNLSDPYADPRFNPEIDKRTGYKTRNMLSIAMKGEDGRILGVFQVLNKRTGAFTAEDVEMLHALATSAALAVESCR